MRRSRGHTVALLPVTLLVAAAFCVPAATYATPPDSEIAGARERVAVAQLHLDELQANLELRAEEHEAVYGQLSGVRDQIVEARVGLQRVNDELSQSTTRLEAVRAISIVGVK